MNSTTIQLSANKNQLTWLKQLASGGEHQHLEFKAKATTPAKIVKELIAFANTNGGTLLVGVDDNGTLAGVKDPDEEIYSVESVFLKHCRPLFQFQHHIIALTRKKSVLVLEVKESSRKPHFFRHPDGTKKAYVRSGDQCLQASRELQEIIRRSRTMKSSGFTYGEQEKLLLNYLGRNESITLKAFCKSTRISRYRASRKLVKLVLSGVLRIVPGESEDRYFARN